MMMNLIKLFMFIPLMISVAGADVLPLQCKSSDFQTVFSCGDGAGDAQIADEIPLLFSGCVPPQGFSFGGWQIGGNGPVLNIATLFNSQDKFEQTPPYIGDIEMVANWIEPIDLETFSFREVVAGVMYNPDINKIYYEFPSGGVVLDVVCAAESEGDGVAVVNVMGESESFPTASNAIDLSNAGNYCWIGLDSPYSANKKYVSLGRYNNCESECAELPVMIALYRYAEAEYRAAYDAVISSLLKVIVGK